MTKGNTINMNLLQIWSVGRQGRDHSTPTCALMYWILS